MLVPVSVISSGQPQRNEVRIKKITPNTEFVKKIPEFLGPRGPLGTPSFVRQSTRPDKNVNHI